MADIPVEWIDHTFGTSDSISVAQEIARALVVFVYGVVLIRAFGRRIFGKWSAVDILVSIIAGSALARTMTGGAPLVGTLAAVTVLVVIQWVLAHISARSKAASRVIEGTPIALGRDGRLLPARMRANAVSATDVAEALRLAGVSEPGEAALITLEPSGKITALKYAPSSAPARDD